MTKSELNKYKALLEAKQAELAGGLRNREGIAIEKTAPSGTIPVRTTGVRCRWTWH